MSTFVLRTSILAQLEAFRNTHRVRSKGSLSVVLHVTRLVGERLRSGGSFPLPAAELRTAKQGQVAGLGASRIKKILARHGIERHFASEGGRTSRGSLGLAGDYIALLNGMVEGEALGAGSEERQAGVEAIEEWWVTCVQEFFGAQHLTISVDPSLSLVATITELLAAARSRQRELPGSTREGAVLQHLIGAKLVVLLGEGKVVHHAASTADAPTGRSGDFEIEGTAIHVTTAPSEALLRKCKNNIDAGIKPIIVVPDRKLPAAEGLAENIGLRNRIEVHSAERFIGANMLERGRFQMGASVESLKELLGLYNRLIQEYESDPSLQVDWT